MLNRRHFLTATGAAAMGFAGTPLVAAQSEIPEAHQVRRVRLRTNLPPNEIHVDPNSFYLYWTLPDDEAIRFACGVGRSNLYEAGTFYVRRKAKWPSWTPTKAMIERNPKVYEPYKDGMPGGPDNPLGARALYLYTPSGRDSYLRIHGTPHPKTIRRRVSNGCARLMNEHIEMLYDMVPIGTRVVLHPMNA